jgi:hypothetical protein
MVVTEETVIRFDGVALWYTCVKLRAGIPVPAPLHRSDNQQTFRWKLYTDSRDVGPMEFSRSFSDLHNKSVLVQCRSWSPRWGR